MVLAQSLALGFLFSFLGSIPPGTLNLSVIQLAVANRHRAALRFALAAALVEYPYAWAALHLASLLASVADYAQYAHLFAGALMLVLGISHLKALAKKNQARANPGTGGFRKGFLLSLANPLAIPFWVGVTAYLRGMGWIVLSTPAQEHAYVLGIALGTFALLACLAMLARRVAAVFQHNIWLKRAPGLLFLGLGCWALAKYFAGG